MTSSHRYHYKRVIIPIMLTCLGYLCYNLNDAGLKFILGKVHFSQVLLTASVIGIFFMAVYGWFREGKQAFRTSKPGLMFVRAALSQVTTFAIIIALPHIHLTTFYTLVFTSPFMVALIAAYFFKDKLEKRRLIVILFGFCVILFIFRPGGALFNGWALLILFSSFVYSWQMLVIRKIGAGESRSFMYICSYVMNFMIAVPLLGDHYVPLTLSQWGLLTGVVLLNSTGMLCISYAYQQTASPSIIAPYHYTQIIWGALLGYFIFHEIPHAELIIGAVLVVLAGLYLLHHETRKAALQPPEA